jgi:hypothetical protein
LMASIFMAVSRRPAVLELLPNGGRLLLIV